MKVIRLVIFQNRRAATLNSLCDFPWYMSPFGYYMRLSAYNGL